MTQFEIDVVAGGPVHITGGDYADCILYLDDFENADDLAEAYCYLGSPSTINTVVTIPLKYIQNVTSDTLLRRRKHLASLVDPEYETDIDPEEKLYLLHEYHYIHIVLQERWEHARRISSSNSGKVVFISHSSEDKIEARLLAVDLAAYGFKPWLDEWEVHIGDSIPDAIGKGIESSDAVVVLLSPKAIKSKWVSHEWQTKLWQEFACSRVNVYPVLLQKCEIPDLLKIKKYADFTGGNRSFAMEALIKSLNRT